VDRAGGQRSLRADGEGGSKIDERCFQARGGSEMLNSVMARAMLPRSTRATVRRPHDTVGHRPSVSVIVPCYNYGHYLSECVQSVLDQQNVRVDVLIIDDASPDGSAEIVKRLATGDSRIRTIFHTMNRGHIATYNEGLAQASGDYTVLLSADDRLTPGCLARATSVMEQYPSVGLTYGFAVDFTDTYLPQARTVAANWIIWQGHNWITHRCKTGHNVLRSPEAVMRTSVLREIGGYRADLPHTADFEFWMRAATVSDVAYISGADQAYYRIHENNMHHSTFDLLDDLSGRLGSFDTIFTERAKLLTNPNLMYDTAHRALAHEALSHAISAYTRGAASKELVDKYVAFALTAWPDARQLGGWRTLCRLRDRRDDLPTRDLALITREAVRNWGYSLNWWRWRWAGVY
jgi:glycosyltransferase involved in cell wall biosynthesis